MGSKKVTTKKNFYLAVLSELKFTTNLTKIQEKLSISKQQLNYYLRKLKTLGFVFNKGHGWWELTDKGKNPTKYAIFHEKDSIRDHANIWETEIEKIPENWHKRIEVLQKKGINFKRVGALRNIPRIKVLGRKVWLCNDHLRIFDTEKASYYGDDAKEGRKNSKFQAMRIIFSLEKKLGIQLNPNKIKFKKEHFALIKNDLAINQNQKGIIWRISDESGEWLLIDDSLGEGGELENTGKKAFKTNPKLQEYWNSMKEDGFKTTDPKNIKQRFKDVDDFLNERFNKFDERDKKFMEIIERLEVRNAYLTKIVYDLKRREDGSQ